MNLDLKAVKVLTIKKLFLSSICLLFISNLGMSQDILLNEVMSSNSTILSPVAEDSYDWAELYNNSDNVLSLDGYFLSDEIENSSMWAFPPGIEIPANSYYTVWLSGEIDLTSEGEVHANFKISSEGESIFLFDSDFSLT